MDYLARSCQELQAKNLKYVNEIEQNFPQPRHDQPRTNNAAIVHANNQ